jgi:hypothetical protein
MHLSCIKISSISKWTETSFHLSLITKEKGRVRPKWFPSLWYVQRKPCTYLASWLALSPNGPKWTSTWVSSPRSTIRCVQNDFYCILRKSCTYLALTLTLYLNGLKWNSAWARHLGVPTGASKMISKTMVRSGQTVYPSCVKISTICKQIEISFHLSLIT